MSEELQQKLRTKLWTLANTLRDNMSASDQQDLKFAIWQQLVAQISEIEFLYQAGTKLLVFEKAKINK